MLSSTAGAILTVVALLAFAWIGIRAARNFGYLERDRYLTARGTQGSGTLALAFFASVLGAWILFSPAEVGTFAGILGVVGYAVGQAIAIGVFALLGPALRRRLPHGTTVLQFVKHRYGRLAHVYVGGVSVLYMFVFLTAELTAIGGAVALISGIDPVVPIVATAVVTAAYTAYGGLPASLATDRWQAWLIMALVVVVVIAVSTEVSTPIDQAAAAGLTSTTRVGAEIFVVLVIAITAANLFHQGFWQRVWSGKDNQAVSRGAIGGALLVIPVLFLMGLGGMIAAGGRDVENPSAALFSLMDGLPSPVLALVVILAVSLVASSVDTLQNGLTATIAVDIAGERMRLSGARIVTILLTAPAAVLAVQEISVLRLFLVADLLAATIAVPVFLGLWRRVTPAAALAGCVAGLVAVIAAGWIDGDGIGDGFRLLTLPGGVAPLNAFIAAVVGSSAVTVALSLVALVRGHPLPAAR